MTVGRAEDMYFTSVETNTTDALSSWLKLRGSDRFGSWQVCYLVVAFFYLAPVAVAVCCCVEIFLLSVRVTVVWQLENL